jgi:tRNA(Leu) C34 or U34 (ribose-2'-O)-methylase TrmL
MASELRHAMREDQGMTTGADHGPGPEPEPRPGSKLEIGSEPVSESGSSELVGVGPWPEPWPDDERFDPDLLREGDRRNVVDEFRYWRVEAIVAELDTRRHPFHVAIENWAHDFNIGSVVRTANAFNAAGVHVVGRRRWNRRGAMVTDRYLHVQHHPDAAALVAWAKDRGLPLLGIDNLPGSIPLETTTLPRECVLVFGQEGPGLSEPVRDECESILSIAQFGSTRSINAGAAAAIAMHSWIATHAILPVVSANSTDHERRRRP